MYNVYGPFPLPRTAPKAHLIWHRETGSPALGAVCALHLWPHTTFLESFVLLGHLPRPGTMGPQNKKGQSPQFQGRSQRQGHQPQKRYVAGAEWYLAGQSLQPHAGPSSPPPRQRCKPGIKLLIRSLGSNSLMLPATQEASSMSCQLLGPEPPRL